MRTFRTALLVLCISGAPMLAACDREVSHQEDTQQKSDGTVKHDDTTVKQDANGNTVKTETKTVDKPAN